MVQAEATARYVRTSAQKAGLVLNLIRGKSVPVALATLKFARKGIARDIEKVLRSAIANATENEKADADKLVVTAVAIDPGPIEKRWLARSMGRANRINRRSSHVTITVDTQE